ncbi:MAG TPA: TolC family protein [Caulobacteraceae bacterium]|jgi:NodT family efflux transporter outer membrane factor (OMF) lipoprotein
MGVGRSSLKRGWALAALLPLLAACATNTKVREADLRVPAAFEARSSQQGQVEIDRWWTLYGDPQLEQLVEEALANSFDIEDALLRLEQAYYSRRAAVAALLPQSSVTGSAAYGGTEILNGGGATTPDPTLPPVPTLSTGAATTLSATFNVSWEVDLFGRRRTTRRLAERELQTATFTYEATRTALAANVAQSLFEARGFALQLADARETVRINTELERIARIRVEVGLSPGSDLDQAVANTRTAEAAVEQLQAQLDTARRNLMLLVGRATDPLASLPVAAEVGNPPPTPPVLPAELLQRRPDVRQAEIALQAELQRLELRRLALYPTINLQPGVTLTQTIGSGNVTSGLWSLGAGLTVPILERPRLLAEVGVQRAFAEQQVVAFERAVQTAYAESENALVLLESDRRRVAVLSDAVARAEAAARKTRTAYSRGFSDLQTALIAETTWRNLHSQLVQAEAILMQRSVQLFRALGGGWTPSAPAAGALTTIAQRGTS